MWVFQTLALLLTSLALATPASANPRDGLILEVSPDASPNVDPRASERLIALEIADIDVPSPPGIAFRAPLYFRILPLSTAAVRIELWELGKPYGVRSVSTVGSDSLKARRIALAAAELARQLRQRRIAELAREKEVAANRGPDSREFGVPIYARFAASGGASGAAIGGTGAWLVGPTLETTLRFGTGQRLSLGAAWLAGDAPVLRDGSMRWLEASLAFAQALPIARALKLELGVSAGAASVRVSGGDVASTLDTWSARAVLSLRLEARLGDYTAMAVGPDVGALLRPVEVTDPGSGDHRLSGVWLGGSFRFSVGREPR
jgi:hypothetical protein